MKTLPFATSLAGGKTQYILFLITLESILAIKFDDKINYALQVHCNELGLSSVYLVVPHASFSLAGLATKVELTHHVRSAHTHERPFKCGECAMEFIASKHLRDHTRIHTGK